MSVALVFGGELYTPPPGNQLQLHFKTPTDSRPPVAFPEPPSLIQSIGSAWLQAHTREQQTTLASHPAKAVQHTTESLFGDAKTSPERTRKHQWHAVPVKDKSRCSHWSMAPPRESKTDSLWANTQPTDPTAIPCPWHQTALPKEANTAALWGQPPSKDQDYAGPWFTVDTTGPEWRTHEHSNPPLWVEPAHALSFVFAGTVYRPDTMPPAFFRFGGVIAPHPIQPKDASPRACWQQSNTVDLSPAFPWGEGRYQRIKDNEHTVDYGGKVIPLPLEPPTPDDKESYLLMNTVNAVRLPDEEPLELLDISIDLDIDSFTWQLSAAVANKAVLNMIEPDANGTKDIKITINGWTWVFMVTRYDSERRFNNERYRIAGESRTRLLSAPYAPLRSKTEDNAISAVQAAEAELTHTGFTLIWDSTETWATPDWILPGGLFSYVNQTPIEVIASIANTAGAVIIPSSDSDVLAVQPRYKISPWNWLEDTTPIDHAIPESMVLSMSMEWRPESEYNAVYVSGINEGVAVAVQRQGSAGDKPAPDIIEDWLTATDVNTERGRNVLSEGGNQAVVTLDLPLTVNGQEPGLVLPGQLVEVMEGSEPWMGLCLSTNIKTAGSGAGKVVQSLSFERHYQES
ncbi:hypothetical protein [Parendozoicomonas sp. Alg238-R29]|uniref:hypothetical protein n=1 Tax=Parendozoicomonas sp. Alg238-R29 TaxID=2993446 RepID=UPI00248F2B2F|nr:hypothetical protein [Parendozoicomonas sp. Alg238-R29]